MSKEIALLRMAARIHAEQWHLEEIASLAKLGRAGRVIAQPGRVQAVMHVLGKTESPAGIRNTFLQMAPHAVAVIAARNIGLR